MSGVESDRGYFGKHWKKIGGPVLALALIGATFGYGEWKDNHDVTHVKVTDAATSDATILQMSGGERGITLSQIRWEKKKLGGDCTVY